MSMRRGWTINGKHFAETTTERGGLRFFIDGKPTRRREWALSIAEAQLATGARLSKQQVDQPAEGNDRQQQRGARDAGLRRARGDP
jgi:hypothetical protein